MMLFSSIATKHFELRVGMILVRLDSNNENHFLHNNIWKIPRYLASSLALSIDKCLSLRGSIIKSEGKVFSLSILIFYYIFNFHVTRHLGNPV